MVKKLKSGPQRNRRVSKLMLVILLTPLVIALTGGTLLYLWSKKKAAPAPALPTIKTEGVDPAIVKLVRNGRAEVEKAPRSGPAWGRLGIILAVNGFINEADYCFGLAEKYEPTEVRWPYWRGLALSATNTQAALPSLERASKICTNISAVALRYAEALLESGRIDEAEKQIQRVYSQNTNDARALLGLARIALARDHLSESLDYLIRSMNVATNIGPAYALMATVQRRLGNAETAEKARRRAATLPESPEWPDPLVREANAYRTGKDSAAAFAESLLQQGRAHEAVALMQQTTRAYPHFVKGWMLLGQGLGMTKDFAGAEKALSAATRLAPDSIEVQIELGGALFAQARYAEAEGCFRQSVLALPKSPTAWFNLGLCLLNQRKDEAALDAFRTAARCKTDFTDAYIRCGQALGRLNREAEAIEELRRALQLSPDNAEAQGMLEGMAKTKRK